MNRYIEEGVLADAISGKRVVVIDPHRADLNATFQSLADSDLATPESVQRTNGRERITFTGGGSIHFICPGRPGRGLVADVVFVRGWNDLSESQREDIAPMVLSRGGELIRA